LNSQIVSSALEDELTAVHTTLHGVVAALDSPLGDLVAGQAKRAYPLTRAAVVLAAAVADHHDDQIRPRRISLAAALEMLYIALNVHRLLVGASDDKHPGDRDSELDRSFVGSAILSGDYCFSHAAQLAAATDNPRVVAVFAHALQVVSEGQLRRQFDPAADGARSTHDETRELLRAGVLAAAALAGIAPDETERLLQLSEELAARLSAHTPPALADGGSLAGLAAVRQARWRALQLWLSSESTNGKPVPASSPLLR
jgi:geranylgeranyl pyrophosphate synthase